MATDVEVQFFSHLNGLTLDNNWGDLIRLLDKTLVTGIDFSQITAASIDTQGDVHITLYAAHNAMLFQVVELSGFTPTSLNQKYRIKGVPNTTQLILKPALDIAERSITAIGTGKLVSLGYEIIFRDTGDVKRVYRAKNPTAKHPFIRVDESLASDTGSYTATYAKYAMVGLLEHMNHIDDYQNPNVLQLPFDPADPAKNWKIIGTGTAVVRGWSRWNWARSNHANTNATDTTSPTSGQREFSIVGDGNAFYFVREFTGTVNKGLKVISGCGLVDNNQDGTGIKDWFLMSFLQNTNAATSYGFYNREYGSPLCVAADVSRFLVTKNDYVIPLSAHVYANAVTPDYQTGFSDIYSSSNIALMTIPLYDSNKHLRGVLPHVNYSGKLESIAITTPILAENSMYVFESVQVANSSTSVGSVGFFLGELE